MADYTKKDRMRKNIGFVRQLLGNRTALFGLIALLVLVVLMLSLPALMGLEPYKITGRPKQIPSRAYPLGTDDVGRDVFARLVFGGRISLLVGFSSTIISTALGVILGMLAGYYRGWVEMAVMRGADIFMSFPSVSLILVLVSIMGPSLFIIIVVMGILGWTPFAKLIYVGVLREKEKEYIEAARVTGVRDLSCMLFYLLPNVMIPVLVNITFRTAQAIITESSLSFLGLGVQQPLASWGNMLNSAQSLTTLTMRPWIWLPPGVLLFITILAVNSLGEGVRSVLYQDGSNTPL
jgi:peptide/nickel transport system permease protein